jgi:hypothetical protein
MAIRRRPLISPVQSLRRLGFYRGVLGGNRTWTGLFVVLVGARALKKVVAKSEEVAATDKLLPGQRLTIIAIDPVAERRAAKRR